MLTAILAGAGRVESAGVLTKSKTSLAPVSTVPRKNLAPRKVTAPLTS
jgi:hypothetical protein